MTEQQLLSALTQAAEASGLPAALQHYYGGNIRLSLPLTKRTCAASIDELMLSVRSQNALKRAGLFTVGAIVQALEADELGKIRNLGRKSMAEIKTRVTVFGFLSRQKLVCVKPELRADIFNLRRARHALARFPSENRLPRHAEPVRELLLRQPFFFS